MRWLVSLVLVCVLSAPRLARADLASSLYGDVRDVIEELIQTEVTTSVVHTIEARSPALAFYMRGTLERLASPYWGSLGRVLKDDLTVAVSDFVYWHLSVGGGDGDIVASAKRFFRCAKDPAGKGDESCKRLLDAIGEQRRPLVEVECRRAKPAADRRVACDIGLAVLAALKGRGEVRQHLVDAMSNIVLGEIADKDIGGRMRDVMTRWMDLPKDLPMPLLEALGNVDLGAELTDEAIEKRCTDPKMLQQALNDPHNPFAWICFAVTHASLPKALAATVKIKENGKEVARAIDYWVIAGALKDFDTDRDDDSALRLLAELAFDGECPAGKEYAEGVWPCSGKRLEPGATVQVTWLGRMSPPWQVNAQGRIGITNGKFLMSSVIKFRKLMWRIQELRSLVPSSLAPTLFHAGRTVSADTAKVLRAAHRMARLIGELRARWYLWSQNQKKAFDEIDVAELLGVARASLGATNTELSAALAFLDKEAAGGSATLDIGDWLRMVMRADYRSLAMESLRAALDLELRNTNRPHETFFLSLAAYLLDNSEGVGEQVARAAFRASAKELLLSASHRGVPRIGDRLRGRLLPRLSMRLSFNDAYAVTDGDTRRYTIATDWPTAMFAVNDYIGLEVSFLDFVAPLAEMALRPAGTYHDQQYVALDALRPRLGLYVAVPQFSRRLALSTGFGTRFVDLEREDDGSGALTARYTYKASLTFDAGLEFVF
ncbi:MAG: hypothetical protein SFX73_21495 [Kofleriaceae bacterium]|nr:hypothetical protein [Kofleriaceae bacterium]